MAQIRWLSGASLDLVRLIEFLKNENPNAAARAAEAIMQRTNVLAAMPEVGRLSAIPGYRELVIPFGSGAYVVWYRIDKDQDAVVLVRIWHGREDRRAQV